MISFLVNGGYMIKVIESIKNGFDLTSNPIFFS
jgi:hypothetical protein